MKEVIPYSEVCSATAEVVMKAASYIRNRHENRRELKVMAKGEHNLVTEVDQEAERILVGGLVRILPEAGFITEEGTSHKEGDKFRWVIDPLDGTTNFIHGVFPFSISVGLVEGDEVVIGVVYEFGLNELFSAWKGGGAWCNGQPIRVSEVKRVNRSLIATGFPYTDYRYLGEFLESIQYFMQNSHGLRRLGSAATDLAYVACGRYEGFYEYGLHPWDVAAGMLLIREAGGEVSDFDGNPDPLFREDIVCSNGHIQKEFQAVTRKIMKKQ